MENIMENNLFNDTPEVRDNKARFIEIFKSKITREGSEKLLDYLMSTSCDFFDAPASTRYHGSYPGGLLVHSLNVYDCLVDSSKIHEAIIAIARMEKKELTVSAATDVNLYHICALLESYLIRCHSVARNIAPCHTSVSDDYSVFFGFATSFLSNSLDMLLTLLDEKIFQLQRENESNTKED